MKTRHLNVFVCVDINSVKSECCFINSLMYHQRNVSNLLVISLVTAEVQPLVLEPLGTLLSNYH